MSKIIYKNPVTSALIINIATLFLLIYSINERVRFLYMLPIIIGVLNRKIMDNGQNITKKQKIIIFSSFLLVLVIYLVYGLTITKMRYS